MADSADGELLTTCFQQLTGAPPHSVTQLRPHASERRMYRLEGSGRSVIGVINRIAPENEAFVYFARLFRSQGLPVPEIYLYRPESHLYLEEDLGDATLLDFLVSERSATGEVFPATVERAYRQVLEHLPRFQIDAARSIDFARCFPSSDFSSHALRADLLAFARELVGRLTPCQDLTVLEQDFATIISFLSRAEGNFFLYRDFQSRNIMLVEGRPYFIDFQGGRRGPLQYDVVSLLYQSSAQLPDDKRSALLEHYLDTAERYVQIDRGEFHRFYNCFIISRMLQVLGVYGRQGLGAGKEYFRNSIPSALRTLVTQLSSPHLPVQLPQLRACAALLLDAINRDATDDC